MVPAALPSTSPGIAKCLLGKERGDWSPTESHGTEPQCSGLYLPLSFAVALGQSCVLFISVAHSRCMELVTLLETVGFWPNNILYFLYSIHPLIKKYLLITGRCQAPLV